jgi:hypothetical protein
MKDWDRLVEIWVATLRAVDRLGGYTKRRYNDAMNYGIEDVTGDDTLEFVDLVKLFFERKNIGIEISEGAVRLSNDKDRQFGLYNIAQSCKGSPKKDWQKLVDEHFEEVNLALENAGKDTSYADAKDLLCVRIYPKDDYAHMLNMLVYKEDLPDTYSGLVIDLPSSVETVNLDDVKRWGVEIDELFKIGLENTFRRYPVNPQELPFVENTTVRLIFEDHFYATTSLLNIENSPQMLGRNGTLVAYPHRHAVLCQPINDLSVVKLLSHLLPFLQMQYTQNPGPISPKLFWYHDKKFTELPYTIDDKSITFFPPEEFISVLNTLKS